MRGPRYRANAINRLKTVEKRVAIGKERRMNNNVVFQDYSLVNLFKRAYVRRNDAGGATHVLLRIVPHDVARPINALENIPDRIASFDFSGNGWPWSVSGNVEEVRPSGAY